MPKKCPSCQLSNKDNAKFCSECGETLPVTCQNCGAEISEKAKFCDQCGKPVADSKDKVTPQEETPKNIPETIKKKISSSEHIVGERRIISVMFADVAGFTALSQLTGAEEISNLMNRCFEIMAREIYRMDGMINKYLGDGLMALFGAPIANEDHAIRAVLAALNIQKAMTGLSDEVVKKWGHDFKLRIGINTGEVVTGKIGNDYQMEYTAMGDTINLASRIEGASDVGVVSISEHTFKRVEYFFEAESVGERQLKGIEKPVNIYQVVRQRRRKSAIELADPSKISPFVGRDTELDMLKNLAETSRQGNGQVAIIRAEPGLGKSRLLYELKNSLLDQDTMFLEIRCFSYAKNVAFYPLIEYLKEYYDFRETDTVETITKRIRPWLEELDYDVEDAEKFVLNLLSIKIDDPSFHKQDPEVIRRKTMDLFKLSNLRDTKQHGMVVVAVEDIHWIDNSTEELLDHMISNIEERQAFIVFTTRPTYETKWASKPNLTLINLKPLSEENSLSLVRNALEGKQAKDDIEAMILGKAHGNPLFIEELSNVLDGESSSIPETIQDIIMTRLDRLSSQTRRIAMLASVIGRDFSSELLEKAYEDIGSIKASLDELVAQLMVYQKTTSSVEYTFKHDLIHEVAYQSMLEKEKMECHLRIAQTMEVLYKDKLEEKCEEIAFHYKQTKEYDKAVSYLVKAAEKMESIFAPHEAGYYYDQAYMLLKGKQKNHESIKLMVEIGVKKTAVLFPVIDSRITEQFLFELEEAAVPINDITNLAKIYYWLGSGVYRVQGKSEKSFEYLNKGFEFAKKTGDDDLIAEGLVNIGHGKFISEDLDGCIEYLTKGAVLMERVNRIKDVVHAYNVIADVYCFRGDKSKAYEYCEKTMALSKTIDDRYSRSLAYNTQGFLDATFKDPKTALESFKKGIEIAEEAKHTFGLYFNKGSSILAYMKLGKFQEAVIQFEEITELFGIIDSGSAGWSWYYGIAALNYHFLKDQEKADYTLKEGEKVSSKTNEAWGKIMTKIVKTVFDISNSGRIDKEIYEYIGETRNYINKTGLFVFHAMNDFLIAITCLQSKDMEGFKKHIDPAIEKFEELEMNWDLEQARKLRERVLSE